MKDHGLLLVCVIAVILLLFVLPWVLSKFVWVILGCFIGWWANNSFKSFRERYP